MIDGRNAPAGSLYNPKLINVIGCITRSSFAKHHRNKSLLRVGKRNPGPAKAFAPLISAFMYTSAAVTSKGITSFDPKNREPWGSRMTFIFVIPANICTKYFVRLNPCSAVEMFPVMIKSP